MFRWGIITMMVLGALLPGCTEPRMESTVVFAEGSDSCHFYRIPAMVLLKNGDVGILYEDGSQSTDNGYDIVFTRIPRRLIRRSLPSC